jgi:hypothetical protein
VMDEPRKTVSSGWEQTIPSEGGSLQILANDFVLLRLSTQGRKKTTQVFYVAQIVCAVGPRMWKAQCMRKYGNSSNQFVFPDKDDCDTYLEEEMEMVLSQPKVVRNIYHFSNDFSAFCSNLR